MSADNLLQLAVRAEFSGSANVTSAHLGVTARDGVAMLTGQVDSDFEKSAAEAAASRVAGVKAIAEENEVKLSTDMRRTREPQPAASAAAFGPSLMAEDLPDLLPAVLRRLVGAVAATNGRSGAN